jgi:hypothetical protein
MHIIFKLCTKACHNPLVEQGLSRHMLDMWDLVNQRNLEIALMKCISCFKG